MDQLQHQDQGQLDLGHPAPQSAQSTNVLDWNSFHDSERAVYFEWGEKRTPLMFTRFPMAEQFPRGYEPEVISALERFLVPGDVAIDAGASVGYHTCLMAKLVGPEGLVFAFEPHMESFQYLAHHVHTINKLSNTAVMRLALWKCHDKTLKLSSTEDLGYSSFHQYANATSTEVVEGQSLDFLLEGEGLHPRAIKIDTEGTEAEVLLGAQHTLERGVDCVIMELNYYLMAQVGRDDMTIRRFMAGLGYDMFLISIGDGQGGLANPVQVGPEVPIKLDGGSHINVLFSTREKVREKWLTMQK